MSDLCEAVHPRAVAHLPKYLGLWPLLPMYASLASQGSSSSASLAEALNLRTRGCCSRVSYSCGIAESEMSKCPVQNQATPKGMSEPFYPNQS